MITQNTETTAIDFDLCSVCAFCVHESAHRRWPTPESLSSGDWGIRCQTPFTDLCRALMVLPLKKLQLGYSEAKASAELKMEDGEWLWLFSLCYCKYYID